MNLELILGRTFHKEFILVIEMKILQTNIYLYRYLTAYFIDRNILKYFVSTTFIEKNYCDMLRHFYFLWYISNIF